MLELNQLPALYDHVFDCLAEVGYRPKKLSSTALGLYVEGMYHRVLFDESDPAFVTILCAAFRQVEADECHATVLTVANDVTATTKGALVVMIAERQPFLSASSEFFVPSIESVTTDQLLRRIRAIAHAMRKCRDMLDNVTSLSANCDGDSTDDPDEVQPADPSVPSGLTH